MHRRKLQKGMPVVALLIALSLSMCGCSGKVNINTQVQLSPRAQAVIALDPDSRNRIELRNRGPGIVYASAYDADNRIDAEITLGPSMHFSDSMRGISSIVLRNLSGYQTRLDLELKHAKLYELTQREAEAGAHDFQ